ncbi:unnamed protein product, partial [Vitis vinifera]
MARTMGRLCNSIDTGLNLVSTSWVSTISTKPTAQTSSYPIWSSSKPTIVTPVRAAKSTKAITKRMSPKVVTKCRNMWCQRVTVKRRLKTFHQLEQKQV